MERLVDSTGIHYRVDQLKRQIRKVTTPVSIISGGQKTVSKSLRNSVRIPYWVVRVGLDLMPLVQVTEKRGGRSSPDSL